MPRRGRPGFEDDRCCTGMLRHKARGWLAELTGMEPTPAEPGWQTQGQVVTGGEYYRIQDKDPARGQSQGRISEELASGKQVCVAEAKPSLKAAAKISQRK